MVFLLSAYYFFYFALVGSYVIYLPKVLEQLEYSAIQIGVVFAMPPIMRFLAPFLFIKHINFTLSLYKKALVAMFMSSLLYYPALENFYALIIVGIIFGVIQSVCLPYVEVIALNVVSKERYGKVRLFGSIGFIVTALLLAQHLDYAYNAIHFLSTCAFITMLVGLFLARKQKEKRLESPKEDSSFSLLEHKYVWVALFFMQVSFAPFYNFFTNYETSFGISLEIVSYLWTFGVLCEIIMFFVQGRILKAYSLEALIQFSVVITLFRWMLLYLFPDNLSMLYFSQSLHAFSYALYHTAAISYLFRLYTQKALAQQFFVGIAYGLGGFIGAIISGLVYDYDKSLVFIFAIVMALLAFIAFRKVKMKVC